MKTVRIGCASAFWGDTQSAARQLIELGNVDYLVFDYLAEITMSILAAKRLKSPEDGYAIDFVEHVITPLLPQIKAQGIRIIANAGGVNPLACKAALELAISKAHTALTVGVVLGDDLLPRKQTFTECLELDSHEPLPRTLVSMNAYLGAPPIAAVLNHGADIVITGRCVDSALVLGPLLHEFNWPLNDYDKLAAGSLAGHLIECGAQCCGGNFTDWQIIQDGFDNMGFPIVEVQADGQFIITKPEGTGGQVNPHTVGEQLLYEIGDPSDYRLPDVICDFSHVQLTPVGDQQVLVTGAQGRAPTDTYKVCATYPAGMRCAALFMIGGIDAARKGRASANAIISKVQRHLRESGLGEFTGVDIHCIGAEESYGPHARPGAAATREVVVKIVVHHPNAKALQYFSREIAQAATAMSPGYTGYFGAGRPDVQMIPKLYSTLVNKAQVPIEIRVGTEQIALPLMPVSDPPAETLAISKCESGIASIEIPLVDLSDQATSLVPLLKLALARSGDKGDHANIGVIARHAAYLPYLWSALTPEAVHAWFAHLIAANGSVQRWHLPGTHSLNFLLRHALGGGGAGSLRTDPQGKAFAQMLLDFPVPIPSHMLEDLKTESSAAFHS